MVTAVLAPSKRLLGASAHPTSGKPLDAFAPENNGCFSRVTHTRPPARARAVNDRTDMPCKGQQVPAARAALELLRSPAGRGFQTLRRLKIRQGTGAPPGAAPPGPKGQRGHLMGIRRSRSRGFFSPCYA